MKSSGDRALEAKKHTAEMEKLHGEEIRVSIQGTEIFDGRIEAAKAPEGARPEFSLLEADTAAALLCCRKAHTEKKICVLNYASFKNPGGGFLSGAMAQEEALCRESFLYSVLSHFGEYYEWNRKHLNRGLYTDRALYSPDVLFERGSQKSFADVLTCACPNWGAARRNGVTPEENRKTLEERIRFVRDICEVRKPEIFIAGAFGCGVFRQDPAAVCRMFLDAFADSSVRNVVFAVPAGSNCRAFREEMKKQK